MVNGAVFVVHTFGYYCIQSHTVMTFALPELLGCPRPQGLPLEGSGCVTFVPNLELQRVKGCTSCGHS